MTSPFHQDYRIALLTYGQPAQLLQRTRLAFRQYIINEAPSDISTICEGVLNGKPNLHEVLSAIRLSKGDNDLLSILHSSLSGRLADILNELPEGDLRFDLELVCVFVYLEYRSWILSIHSRCTVMFALMWHRCI